MKTTSNKLTFILAILFVSIFFTSCGGINGRYKNSVFIYDIKSDGKYDFLEQESVNDDSPEKEKHVGSGKWKRKGNQIIFDGPCMDKEYTIKNGNLCTYSVFINTEVCYDKQ